MKIHTPILLAGIFACGFNPVSAQPVETKVIDANAYSTLSSTDANGNFNLLFSDYDTTTWLVTSHLVKFDPAGNLLYHKNIPNASNSAIDISATADGGMGILLHDGASLFTVIRLDASGNISWQKNYSVTAFNTAYYSHSLNSSADGSLYLTISDYAFAGIVKIDNSGNVAWAYAVSGDQNCGKCPGFRTTITDDGGVVNTLKDESYECITKLNSNGQLAWSKSFNDGLYRWPEFIKSLPNNELLIAGNNTASGSYFQKLDANGDLLFAKTSYSFTIIGIQPMASGEFFVAGNNNSNLVLLHLSANGSLLNQKTIGYISGVNYGQDIFSESGNSLNFISSTSDYKIVASLFNGNLNELCNTYSSPIAISDDNGFENAVVDTVPYIVPLSVSVSNSSFSLQNGSGFTETDFCAYVLDINKPVVLSETLFIYPNPSAGSFTIETDGIPGAIILTVYDMNGKLVHTQKPSGPQTIIENLAPGIYNVCATSDTGLFASKRVIIR